MHIGAKRTTSGRLNDTALLAVEIHCAGNEHHLSHCSASTTWTHQGVSSITCQQKCENISSGCQQCGSGVATAGPACGAHALPTFSFVPYQLASLHGYAHGEVFCRDAKHLIVMGICFPLLICTTCPYSAHRLVNATAM